MSRLKIPVGEDDHVQGAPTALCTLLEYGDYQCPACGAAYPVVKRLQKHFGDNLRFVFRNFPLTQIHPFAELAAETAEFASTQGKFWEAHALIYENQDELGGVLLRDRWTTWIFPGRLRRSIASTNISCPGPAGFFRWSSQWSQRHARLLH